MAISFEVPTLTVPELFNSIFELESFVDERVQPPIVPEIAFKIPAIVTENGAEVWTELPKKRPSVLLILMIEFPIPNETEDVVPEIAKPDELSVIVSWIVFVYQRKTS